jgi:hypothetical protein
VTGWKMVPGASVMYNLEVAQDHTYTVGDGQWVVHNCASGPIGSFNRLDDNYLKRTTLNPHEFKEWFVGKGNVSLFDIYVDSKGNIFLLRKGAPKSQAIETGYNIDEFQP